MKLKPWHVLIVGALFAAGCAEERIPPEKSDAWEVSADTNTAEKTAGEKSVPQAGKKDAKSNAKPVDFGPDVVAVLKGSAFRIPKTTGTANVHGDTFVVSHYFAAEAPVEFKTSVTMMETHLEGRNRDGAVPVVGLRITNATGKYRTFGNDGRPIDGKQVLKDKYDIEPGKYKVTISYYKDTVGEKRPTLTLDHIVFRNKNKK